jgi:hypothetical protein
MFFLQSIANGAGQAAIEASKITQEGSSINLWSMISQGGVLMIPLAVLFAVAVLFFI